MESRLTARGSFATAAICILILTGGCGDDDSNPNIPPGDTPTYTQDIAPILQTGCNCHQPGGPKHADVPLDTYERAFSRRIRIKERAGVEGSMPPTGPLPQAQRDLIISWVDGGAPQ